MSKKVVMMFSVILGVVLICGSVFAAGGGEKGEAALPAGPLLPWTGEEVVWDGFGADLGMKNDQTMPVYQEYLKTTGNARIEWQTFPWNDYDQKLNLYLQSGDMPDIMWTRDVAAKIATFGTTGMFLDWDKYKNRMPNMQKWVSQFPFLATTLTETGERLGITDVANAEYIGEGFFYNAELLRRAGITSPPDTLEEMIEDMITVKKKVPGVDGYLSYWGLGYIISAMSHSMDAITGVGFDTDTDKWIYGPTMDPAYKDLIRYMNTAYEAGVFNPDAIAEGITNEKVDELIAEGNYAFSYRYYGSENKYFDPLKGLETPFVGMKPPSYKGKTYYWITVPHDKGNYWAYMSPKDVKMPELLAAYVDNIMSMETYLLFEWGIEGETYRVLPDGRPEYIESVSAAERSDLGVYNFWDPRYIHFSDYKTAWFSKNLAPGNPGRPAAVADVKRLQAGEMEPIWGWPRPQMSPEANDEISKIMTPINTFVDEQRLKFITGDSSMSEWDDFVAQINQMGNIQKVLDYYNAGKQVQMGERKYPDLFE